VRIGWDWVVRSGAVRYGGIAVFRASFSLVQNRGRRFQGKNRGFLRFSSPGTRFSPGFSPLRPPGQRSRAPDAPASGRGVAAVSALGVAVGGYALASLLTFSLFALDKRQAERGRRRIPESRLHTLEFLGGWPGALLAMQVLRHKRRKPSYWLVTAAIAALHVAAWVAFWQRLPPA